MNKEEHREERRDERKEAKPARSTGLGKHAKIGVGVILTLLVVLGAVAAVRLTGSGDDDKLASADHEKGAEKAGKEGHSKEGRDKEGRDELFPKGIGPKQHGSGQATVVTPRPFLEKTHKPPVDELDRWKLPSGRSERKRDENDGPAIGLSLPEPPKPREERRDRYEKQPDRYAIDSPAERHGVGARPLRGMDSEMPALTPIDDLPARHLNRGPDRNDSSGFAIADSGPAPLPSYREPPQRGFDRRESRPSAGLSSLGNPPPQRNDGKYEVQPNDSYWTISERLYGTGAYFKALAEHNRGRGKGEEQLKPGELVLAPGVADLEKSYPDLCPKASRRETLQNQSRIATVSGRGHLHHGRTYTVAEGDTLFNIARYELGKASRWVEIYELNREVLGKDFNYLTPGTQLAMPDGEKADAVTRQPSSTYRMR
jgi:nucleoid-associated protein YgaU